MTNKISNVPKQTLLDGRVRIMSDVSAEVATSLMSTISTLLTENLRSLSF